MSIAKNNATPIEYGPDDYLQRLIVTKPLGESIYYSAIQALQLPLGSYGLDAGCGIGLQTLQLAEAIGSDGHVTGLDISPAFLAYGRELVNDVGLSKQINFQEGSVNALPFDDKTFDWAWSANLVGYAPLEPLPLLKELVRVVKPGGIIAIIAWSSEQLLPGYPLLEAKLQGTSAGIAPFTHGKNPELHFQRALGWFNKLGIEDPKARTFVYSAFAPLSDDLRDALAALFKMRWPNLQSELPSDDWAEYQRLCLPESPDFVLNLPDYYGFFTYSMFSGRIE